MKKIAYLTATAVISVLIVMSVYSQDEMTVVDNSVFKNPKRAPSLFQHDQHNENAGTEACNVCHHVYNEGSLTDDESSEDQRCSDCHELKASGDNIPLMKAFHKRCKSCHLEKKQGPVMCGECHKK